MSPTRCQSALSHNGGNSALCRIARGMIRLLQSALPREYFPVCFLVPQHIAFPVRFGSPVKRGLRVLLRHFLCLHLPVLDHHSQDAAGMRRRYSAIFGDGSDAKPLHRERLKQFVDLCKTFQSSILAVSL